MTDGHHRIAILGAGAVGGMLGVLLSRAGHAVTLLTTDRTSTAVNLHGLTLHSARYGDLRAQVPARPWLTAPVDILFVAVKAPDLLGALARVPPALVHGAVVVPLLNGVDHVPLMRAVFTHAAVIPMTVAVEATRLEPGVIEHVSVFADYAISAGHRDVEIDPGTVLQQAGLDVDASAPDEPTLLWRKLTFLAPLALLTTGAQAALGPAREDRPEVLDALAAEATSAATACNARIDPAVVVQRLTSLPGSMRSSMLKDSLTGAVLELDAIAGPILRNAPDRAPVTRSVAGEIARSAAARWPISS